MCSGTCFREPSSQQVESGRLTSHMANLTHGMDVEAVRRIGQQLQSQSSPSLKAVVAEIDGVVRGSGSCWSGSDGDQFRSWWPATRIRMIRAVDDLVDFGQAALRNCEEQVATSAAESLAGPMGLTGAAAWGRPDLALLESSVDHRLHRDWGLGLRWGGSNGLESVVSAEATEYRFRTDGSFGMEADDVVQVAEFVAATRGRDLDLPIAIGAEIYSTEGVEFIWRQERGEGVTKIEGVASIFTRSTSFWNWLTGYSRGDLLTDIGKGDIAQPSAIAEYSAGHVAAAASLEAGDSAFGARGDVSVERATETWVDGSVVDRVSMRGGFGASGGVHLDAGLVGVDVTVGADAEGASVVERHYSPDGSPSRLVYVVEGEASLSVEAGLDFAGGGTEEWSSSGVMVQRMLEFDLSDPAVFDAVNGMSTSDLVSQSRLATESVKVFDVSGSGSGASAIVFDTGSEARSLDVIESMSRPPY